MCVSCICVVVTIIFAHAWNNLGNVGGGKVGGAIYDKKSCYIKAVEAHTTLDQFGYP